MNRTRTLALISFVCIFALVIAIYDGLNKQDTSIKDTQAESLPFSRVFDEVSPTKILQGIALRDKSNKVVDRNNLQILSTSRLNYLWKNNTYYSLLVGLEKKLFKDIHMGAKTWSYPLLYEGEKGDYNGKIYILIIM